MDRKGARDACVIDELSVKIIDKESLEVIMAVPSQELLDIKDQIGDMAGVLFDKKIECKDRP